MFSCLFLWGHSLFYPPINCVRAIAVGKSFLRSAATSHKGFEFLVRAMRGVRDDAVLVLGGTGPLSGPLQELAATLGLGERVIFTGRIAEEALPAYYHAADIYCLPSVEPSEAFGLVQVEAMACRKPVISCELGNGVSYVNRDGVTGLVVPPRDPRALADALNRLLEDGALRKKMGDAGHARAKSEFTLDRMWDGMLDVYRTVNGEQGIGNRE